MPLRAARCLFVAAAFLAGCIGGADPSADRAGDAPGGAVFTDEKGAIEGVALDDALLPVEGADVVLGENARTTTAADGTFAFGLVEPGDHGVTVTHGAYEDFTTEVNVVAGEATSVRVSLVRLPSADAYHETFTQAGFMACGVGGRVAGIPWTFAACGPIRILGFDDIDNFMLNWPEAEPMTGVVGFFGETEWESTQLLAKELDVRWFLVNVPYFQEGWSAVQMEWTAGPSPLSVRVDLETLEEAVEDGGFCEFDECLLNSGHYPANQTFGTPVDQTVVFQQRFDDYLTLFRGGELPETFTAIPDQ